MFKGWLYNNRVHDLRARGEGVPELMKLPPGYTVE